MNYNFLTAQSQVQDAKSGFIVNPVYDAVFFIGAPVIALFLGMTLSFTPLAEEIFVLNGKKESYISLFSGMFTMAHLFIVFFRSHGNPRVFRMHPQRFIWAPLILFTAMMLSSWVLVFVFVLAVWWDVYHSALQTFGLGRLYDRAMTDEDRAWDRALNLFLYIGPILGGAALMDHVVHFNKFKEVGSAFFTVVPAYADAHHAAMTKIVSAFGLLFLAIYLGRGIRRFQNGGAACLPKTLLYLFTGLCSIYAWGFNSFGQAFFIMNFFHALQYFALIAHTEKEGIRKSVKSPLMFICTAFLYGFWAKIWGESSHAAFSLLLTVSILHFWYDGFIWSVKRGDV